MHEDEIEFTTTTTTTDSPSFLDFLKRKKRNNQREDNLEEAFIRKPNATLNVPSNMQVIIIDIHLIMFNIFFNNYYAEPKIYSKSKL